MSRATAIIATICILVFAASARAAELHVPSEYAAIQAAIDAAYDGDTVIVADGTYTGEGNRDIDFLGKAITVRSESGPENCIIDCNGLGSGFHFRNGEDANCILDGFRITRACGAGIYCLGSAPTIKNCIVAKNMGSGVYCGDYRQSGDALRITNCIICNNSGGGVRCRTNGTVRITNCTISGNSRYAGGGISCESNSCGAAGTFIITNCIIENNTAEDGGGIAFYRASEAKVAKCVISGNFAEGNSGGGGGIFCSESSPSIVNCRISGNSADDAGGGIQCGGYSSPAIVNCTITDNSADRGGGIYCSRAGIVTISSCILWGNEGLKGPQLYLAEYANALVSYTNLQGGQDHVYIDNDSTLNWGNGNIAGDPHFAFDSDYHIMQDSPCIDAGGPNYMADANETDLDGNPRVINDRIDMGAYEYNPNWPSIAISSSALNFTCADRERKPKPQTLLIRNCGGGLLQWQIQKDCSWLRVLPTAGCSVGQVNEVILKVNLHGLDMGHYTCTLSVWALDTANAPRVVKVRLHVGREIIYVPSDVPKIQQAVEYVLDGGKVIVEDGIYTGTGNRDIDFFGKAITLISENGPDNCIIDCNGSKDEPHCGFYFHSGEGIDSVLDGFTIIHGYAYRSSWSYGSGGGIYCDRSSPIISNCAIKSNSAERYGGGIYCYEGNPEVRHCEFLDNLAGDTGGGMFKSGGRPTVENCVFVGNSSQSGGAFAGDYWGRAILNDCLFSCNTATKDGGAIVNRGLSTCSLTNSTISFNSTAGRGAVFCAYAAALISNCVIYGNLAASGGGVYCKYSYANISNSAVSGNLAFDNGGGVYCDSLSTLTTTNCTLTGNIANGRGGGIAIGGQMARSMIKDCILWDNVAQEGTQLALVRYFYVGYETKVCYSNLQGGRAAVYVSRGGLNWSPANIDADPCFVDPGYWVDVNSTPADPNDDIWIDGDYRLLAGSACIDSGDPNYLPEPNETDLDGNPRVIDGDEDGVGVVDMGAYEFWPAVEGQMKLTPQTLNCGSKGKFVKAHIVLPEEILPEDIDVNSPAVADPPDVESEYIKVFTSGKGTFTVEIAFDRAAFCEALTETGEIEVTVTGLLTTGREFYATDTIRIRAQGPHRRRLRAH